MNNPSSLACPHGTLSALWWGWIAAPAWWLIQFEVRYALVPWACAHGQRWLVPGAGVVALVVSIGFSSSAWRARRKTTGEQPLALLAIGRAWLSTLFGLLVLAQLLPDIFFDPCAQ
jgi:hypothetical protein